MALKVIGQELTAQEVTVQELAKQAFFYLSLLF